MNKAKRLDFLASNKIRSAAAAVHWHYCRVFGDFWSNRTLNKSLAKSF